MECGMLSSCEGKGFCISCGISNISTGQIWICHSLISNSSKMVKDHSKKKGDKDETATEADPDAFVFSHDIVIADVQRKVMSVFEVFDVQGQRAVDVREVGTMVRALDLYPSESDLHDIISAVEELTTKGTVKMNTFIKHMTKLICDGKHKPVPRDDLVQAFRALDKEKKGVLDPSKFKEMLMKEGEPFTAEEADEMFNLAVNKGDNLIHYDEYVDKLYKILHL